MNLVFWLGVASAMAAGPQTQPTSRPAGKVAAYQPGIQIDWGRREVLIDSTVVLREGLLELFACSPGTREHESILRVNCRPQHIYEALGLIGLTPGTPPGWDEKADRPIPATGDRVDALVRWQADGRPREASACDWMAQNDKPLPLRPWVFAGSFRTQEGRLAADGEGTALTVVDFPDALLSLPEYHSADNDQLWLAARTAEIPPTGTSCTLVLRPATDNHVWQVTLDRFGRMTLGGESISSRRLQEKVIQTIQSGIEPVIELHVDGAVGKPLLDRTVQWLNDIGVSSEHIHVRRLGAADFPEHDPDAGMAFLKSRMHDERVLLEQLGRNQRVLAEQIRLAGVQLEEIGRQLRDSVRRGEQRVREAFHRGAGQADKP